MNNNNNASISTVQNKLSSVGLRAIQTNIPAEFCKEAETKQRFAGKLIMSLLV